MVQHPKKPIVSRMKCLKITSSISFIALIVINYIGLHGDDIPVEVPQRPEAVFSPIIYSDHSTVSLRSASVGYVLSVRGAGAVNRSLAIMGALSQNFPNNPCSLLVDATIFDELRQQYRRIHPWCNVSLLKNEYSSNELPFLRTALDFADAAFRKHHFSSAIWINTIALPSCAQLNELTVQLSKSSLKVESKVEFIIPEVALNLADASWSSVPIFGISVNKANEATRSVVRHFESIFLNLIGTHGTRKVFPLRSVMLLFREAALRIQLEYELGHNEVETHLRGFNQSLPSQKDLAACSLDSNDNDKRWLVKNFETLNSCARLQTLGRSVALRISRHTTDAITLPVLESALGTNASSRPIHKCSFKDCYTTKHPWETDFSRVGQIEPLTDAERRAVNNIYAPLDVPNQKSPSIAIITLLGVGELVVRRDSRSYMVRVKQLFSELSNGHISFHLYFAHELVCGDDEKTWANIESMSYGVDGPQNDLSTADAPEAVKEARSRREAARVNGRLGLRGEFSKILALGRALEDNARKGGADWILFLDSDVWLHPNLMKTAALFRILSTTRTDKFVVVGNNRYFNTGFIAFRTKGAPGSAAREFVRDWWAVAGTPGAIECHAYDQAAAQALVLLRATNWTTKEPGNFTCSLESKCGGNNHPVFKTCDRAYNRGLKSKSVDIQRFDRGDANDDPKIDGIFVLSETDLWPRPMCFWCTTLQDIPEEYSNHKVNRGFTNYNTLLGPKRWPAQLPAPIYDGWLCNHKGEWLFRRTYFGDEVTDGSAPQPQNKSLYRMVHLPSILPEPIWSEELYKLHFDDL